MIVQDQIVSNPKIMLVGEAPGATEEKVGRPFAGRAGQQLDRLLLAANIIREECYITNVTSERPRKNDFGIYYRDSKRKEPTDALVHLWEELRQKILHVNPKVVICLGNEALKGVRGLSGIEARRGSIYHYQNISVVPTFHPSAIMRGGGTSHWYLPASIHDLIRAKEIATGGLTPHEPRCRVLSDSKALFEWFIGVSEASFDIETSMFGGESIRCIGFAKSAEEGIVVPMETTNPQAMELLHVIREYMTTGKIAWIGQNAYNFDIPRIKRQWGFEVKNFTLDTMVLHHMLYPEFPHDLATIASFFTTIPYWKDTSEENLYAYNAHDTVATLVAAQKMREEAKKVGLWDLYETYYHKLLRPLSIITMRGMRVDKEYQKQLKGELRDEIKGLQKELDTEYSKYTDTSAQRLRLSRLQRLGKAGRKSIKLPNPKKAKITRRRIDSMVKRTEAMLKKQETLNVRSTKELGNFLYTVLGLPRKTKAGKVTTDETALNQLFIKTQHPFLKTMLKLRRTRNKLSRWGNIRTDEQGLIGTTYSFADTGRLRSGKFDAK